MSSKALRNSPDDCGLNAIAAAPAVLSPSSTCSVTAAVVSAKRRSSFGPGSFFRPKRTSLSPTHIPRRARHLHEPTEPMPARLPLRDRAAHLARNRGEGGDPLLERRMIHEELGNRALRLRGNDEERVHSLDLAQVL